jgi:short subunit dehydrogenase-like uncharacterized protein
LIGPVVVFGATGAAGLSIAVELARRDVEVVVAGRDPARVARAAELVESATGTRPGTTAQSGPSLPAATSVVVNAAGPFSATSRALVDKALAGGAHYIDIANDLPSVFSVLRRGGEASIHGLSLVTASGFGATAGEAVVRHVAARLAGGIRTTQVASMPVSRAETAGFRRTVLEVFPQGVQVYRDGQLRRQAIGRGAAHLDLPTGARTLLPVPVGELEAARRASGAPDVTAYSSELPSGLISRLALPLAQSLLRLGPLRRSLAARAAGRPGRDTAVAPGTPSLAWARLMDVEGRAFEALWEFPEGYETAARAVAEVSCRLAAGQGRPGAWFPGELFGLDIARAAGGRLLVESIGDENESA